MQEDEKQLTVINRFRTMPEMTPYLCFLNVIFGTNFPKTPEYKKLDKRGKYKMLRNIFGVLCQQLFRIFWLIAIDDAEYIDDESWLLFDRLLDMNIVFIVATMGTEKELSLLAMEILKKPRIKSIELKGIDKWYHVGLACQMLKVDGIPPELEKTIQTKSNGNPGWIDSFLVSLMQSGGLLIHEMSRQVAYEGGIVIPPLYMTMRLSREEMRLWVQIMEERKLSSKENKMTHRWKMFIDSCRESYPDLTVAKTFSEKMKQSQMVNIGMVNQGFNLDDVDPEFAIDVIILKTFDALTSYEQLLLKCSAILGDTFPRDMLLYIMSSSAIRLTALAVQKLFEIHVLSCAKGNFIEGGLSFKERLINPNEDMSVRCDCKGLIVDETCTDLPKYASCGYLRFRSSEFRETTYNLLTDNQKREFHERAIRYLEKETRRCRACGNGYFVRQMGGGRLDQTLRIIRRKEKKKSLASENLSLVENMGANKLLQHASFVSFESYGSGTKSRDHVARGKDTMSIFSTGSAGTDTMSMPGSHSFFSVSNEIGFTTIRKLKDNYHLIRTFSNTDYTQCTCPLVLSSMYFQLIEHCKGAGLVEKIMNAIIEYSYVCIENKNIPQTIKVLEEAMVLLEGPMKEQVELDWMILLKRGKLLTLMGIARMELGDNDSINYFLNALKCYGVYFPKANILKKMMRNQLRLSHTIRFYLSRSVFSKKADDDVAEYNNNVSECLSFLCKYFINKNNWQDAELTAMYALNKAIVTETDFEKLCIAYAYYIFVASTIGHVKTCIALEVFALRTCHKKKTYVELEELKAVSYLYYTVARARLRRGEIDKFTQIGYLVWRLSTSSQNEFLIFRILPLLAYVVLAKKQLLEFTNILQEIQFLLVNDTDNSVSSWYYAMCLVVHLETGLTAEPYSKSLKFMQGEGLEPTIRDPDGKKRLIVCLWLWEVRNNNWEAAIVWQKAIWDFEVQAVGESMQNLITGLYLLEGLIIYLVNKMDKKNLQAIAKTNDRINAVFKIYEKVESGCRAISPRLYHLRAYYTIARNNDYKGGLKLLRKGRRCAELSNNEMELHFMKHSELAWCRKLSREDFNNWRDHCDDDNTLDLHDVYLIDKYIPFSLPVPIYI
ncbi:hypothetical protein JTB14_002570 [Gonioctena quinquepunctata]|nr:hypothetical protein JTB14_002570 [Gonioctena quinquepunctata]